MAMTKDQVESYLGSTDVRTPLEQALNSVVSSQSSKPWDFFSSYFMEKTIAMDLRCLTQAHTLAPSGSGGI